MKIDWKLSYKKASAARQILNGYDSMLFFEKIFNGTTENFGNTVKRLDTGFIDVLVPLFIHLDGAETDTGALRKRGLCAPVSCTDTF